MNARECLELASQNQISPDRLYDFFSQNVPRLTVVYQNSEAGRKPLLAKSNHPNGKNVIAFTDVDVARYVRATNPEYLVIQEEPALPFLLKAFRSDAEGVLFNPGLPSRLYIDKGRLMALISAYAVHILSHSAGAWLPSRGNELLLAPYEPGKFTVVIYVTEKDARHVSAQQGGEVRLASWDDIFGRVAKLGAPAPLFHSGLPEQMLLTPSQVVAIQQGPKLGYVEPEITQHPFIPVSDPASEQTEDAGVTQEVKPDESVSPFEEVATTTITDPTIQNRQEEENDLNPVHDGAADENREEEPTGEVAQTETIEKDKGPKEPLSVEKDSSSKKVDMAPSVATPTSEPTPTPAKEHVVPGNLSIPPELKAQLEQLERATMSGQGVANGWEVCRLLADSRRIWVITDHNGNMVILAGQDQSPIVDFFTSDAHAEQLILEAKKQNSSLPEMMPRLVSTKKLFRALASRQPIVWINRGTPVAWTSVMGDTIPYILQLMAQNERNQN
ncbi:hypothetical protein [Thermoactinomyces sp. DSM 45892]|uniref:hypothetical protein n=1 Tax=Thermoactinomyces sp. DSM 45892 TaxID=1882753 RepID=UPI0008974CE3|nr:hypothetical protein [Thermoactinomyces sp. DSM 45892]SDY26969.1 hypothetical protein SAMN05444416_103141 [Thermoactinomyces sp. DSM 45892]